VGAHQRDQGSGVGELEPRDLRARRTLRDPEAEAHLRSEGYAVVDLADATVVDRLEEARAVVGATPGDPGLACHATFQSYDVDHKRLVAQQVRDCLASEVDHSFDRYDVLLGSFIVKWPGDHSGFGFHQDLTFVDERRFVSVVAWIPLDDVTLDDGPLWVAPRSHRWRLDPRGLHGVPFAFEQVAERVAERHSVPLEVRRGQMVVFDNSLIHASPPNRSNSPRVVALAQLVPRGVPVIQYFGGDDGRIEALEVHDDAFWHDSRPLVEWSAPDGLATGDSGVELGGPMTDDELDRLVATGLAVEADNGGPGAINAFDQRCFRCGDPVTDRPAPSPWVGNNTVLCQRCELDERARSTGPARLASTPEPSAPPRGPSRRRPLAPVLGAGHGRGLLPPDPGPVLVDASADARLRRDGFVKVPFPLASTAGELLSAYGDLHGWQGSGMECDMVNEDLEYRHRSCDVLSECLDEPARRLFVDHVPFLRNFLCKWPGDDSDLYLHRDWMYVDESEGDRSYVVWAPLVDVTEQNGPLQVLRHSHRIDRSLRGTNLNSPWVDDAEVRARMLTIPVAVGEAVVFDNALVHCSPLNATDRPRLVAAVALRPSRSGLVHFRRVDDGTAARYDLDEDFFVTVTPQEMLAAPLRQPPADVVLLTEPVPSVDQVVRCLSTSVLTRLDDRRRARS